MANEPTARHHKDEHTKSTVSPGRSIDLRSVSLTGLFILGSFYTLYFARQLFLPLVIALMLSFLLAPVVRGLKRIKVPDVAGAALLLLVLLGTAFYGFYALSVPASGWIDNAPENIRRIEYKLQELIKPVEEVSKATKQAAELTKINKENETETVAVRETTFLNIILDQTWEFIIGLALIIIFLYFLLASGDLFLLKLVKVMPRSADKKRVIEIARQTENDISVYLISISIINMALGVIIGLAMYLLGMPNAVLWGVMAGFLNFIPYLGALVGISVVGLVALTIFDSVTQALLPPVSYFLINALEGNFITPMLLGRRLTLNPVVIFMALIFWSWLWGIPGALIAVPITAVFKIVCDHITPMRPIGEFLGK